MRIIYTDAISNYITTLQRNLDNISSDFFEYSDQLSEFESDYLTLTISKYGVSKIIEERI